MKRIVVPALLGLSISGATAFGQTHILFDTYGGNPVVWTSVPALAPAGEAGSLVSLSDNFKVDLLWQFGSVNGDAGLAVPVGTPYGPGYFAGGNVIPAPPLSPGLSVTFTVIAWNGASYPTSGATGSATWTEVIPAGNIPLNMPTLTVQLVPEPSLLALGSLAGFALLSARRHKG